MTTQSIDSINSQACAWIAKLHGGEPTPKTKQQLHKWMAQSPAHKAEIKKVAKLWGELNVLTELSVAAELPAKTSLLDQWGNTLASIRGWRLGVASGVCAAIVVLAVVIMPGSFINSDPNSYHTAIGEQQLVTLSDGSTILLNTNSQVRVDYQADSRNIYMQQGQAHFEVATNKAKPFKVYVGQEMVRAVGTAFTVYINKQLVEVTVTEGVVELNTPELSNSPPASIPEPIVSNGKTDTAPAYKPVGLARAGENVTINPGDNKLPDIQPIDTQELSRKLAWHHGMLRFSGDSLQDVVAEISRYTDLNIKIVDPSISQMRIGGFFKVGETDKMFEALETSFGIQVIYADNQQVQLIAAAPQ